MTDNRLERIERHLKNVEFYILCHSVVSVPPNTPGHMWYDRPPHFTYTEEDGIVVATTRTSS
jgi:hypothetical protein